MKLFHIMNGVKVEGMNPQAYGDSSALHGNISSLKADHCSLDGKDSIANFLADEFEKNGVIRDFILDQVEKEVSKLIGYNCQMLLGSFDLATKLNDLCVTVKDEIEYDLHTLKQGVSK